MYINSTCFRFGSPNSCDKCYTSIYNLTSDGVIAKCYYVVCAENHVRSWSVARFRGCISTQPGSTSGSSFKVLSLEGASTLFYPSVSIGMFCMSLSTRACTYTQNDTHLRVTHNSYNHTLSNFQVATYVLVSNCLTNTSH